MGERHDEPTLDELRLDADRWGKDKVHTTPITYKLLVEQVRGGDAPGRSLPTPKVGPTRGLAPRGRARHGAEHRQYWVESCGKALPRKDTHSFNADSRGRWLWRFAPLQRGGILETTMAIAAPLATEAALGAAPPGGTSIWGRGPVLFTEKPSFLLIR
jgi:hypothetical protein